MRVHSLILVGVLGLGGVASADPLAQFTSRVAHVYNKVDGNAHVERQTTRLLQSERRTIGAPGQRMSTRVRTDGQLGGQPFHQLIGSTMIGKVLRTESVTVGRGDTRTVSSVESMGARPAKLTVIRNQESLNRVVGIKGEKIERTRDGHTDTLRDKNYFTLFGTKIGPAFTEKTLNRLMGYKP